MLTSIIFSLVISIAYADLTPNWKTIFDDLKDGKYQRPEIKYREDLPIDPPVCPTNVGPYWVIPGSYSYQVAADACAAYGWRLAMLTQENTDQLNQLMISCPSALYWVAGVHGLPADPCALAFPFGQNAVGFQNFGTIFCGLLPGGVICEEMPQVTVSQTETLSNLTISFGQTTTTTQSITTRTVRPYHPQCSDCDSCSGSTYCDSSSGSTYCPSSSESSCDWTSDSSSCSSSSSSSSSSDCGCPQRGRHYHKMLKPAALIDSGHGHCPHRNNTSPVCYGENCLPVCNATINGIHVITANVNFTDAAAECAKYGWSLLDLTTGQSDDVANVFKDCPEIQATQGGYVNSFNGVQLPCPMVQAAFLAGGLPLAIVRSVGTEGGCGLNPPLPVYCQEHCPFPVAESGSEIGQVSLTTDLSFTTATLFTPSTTVVISQSCTESVFIN